MGSGNHISQRVDIHEIACWCNRGGRGARGQGQGPKESNSRDDLIGFFMAESFTCASIKVVARGESGGKDSLEASLMDPTLGCTLRMAAKALEYMADCPSSGALKTAASFERGDPAIIFPGQWNAKE